VATRPVERSDRFTPLALIALAAVIGALTWRRFHTPAHVAPVVLAALPTSPAADLDQLMPYVAPSRESAVEIRRASTPLVLARDPFDESAGPARDVAPRASESIVTHEAAPRETAPDTARKWNVTAVLITGSRKAAVINDAVVSLGGRLPGGAQLTEVERDHVVLTDARGERRTIRILDGSGS
jgi:hypothetical protein